MAKTSENAIKVISYLKENADKNLTSTDVAEALNLSISTVNGVFTSAIQKKDLGFRQTATVKGPVDISFLAITNAGKNAGSDDVKENGKAILAYLTEVEGQNVTIDDITAALNMDKRQFTGTFNSLVKKGFAARNAAKVEGDIEVKYLKLTDAGMNFTPDEDAE